MANKLLVIIAIVMLILNIGTVEAQRQRRKRKDEERDITAEEVVQITEDKEIKDTKDDVEEKKMMEEWDKHMKDFVPDDMLTVELNPREEIVSLFTIIIYFASLVFT